MLAKAIGIVAVIFLMVALGFALRRRGFLRSEQAPGLLSSLVLYVGLPASVAAQLFRNYTRESLVASLPAMGIAYLSIVLMYFLARAVAVPLRIPENRRGTFAAMVAFSNTIFIGLPVNAALFGEEALPATLLYYIANTSLFWVVGVMGIRQDGSGVREKLLCKENLRKMLSPPLICFIICALLILLGFSPPQVLLDTAGYLGNIVTPLSLLFLGAMLGDMVAQGLRWQRGYGWIVVARFLIGPALVFGLMRLFGGMPPLYQRAFLMQASMPVQTSCAIVAHTYGADVEYATGAVSVSTVFCVATIPLFAWITTCL